MKKTNQKIKYNAGIISKLHKGEGSDCRDFCLENKNLNSGLI